MPKALREQTFTFDMLDDLHLQRSKKGTPGQQGGYTGVIIDTHLEKYQLTAKKEPKLLEAMAEASTWTLCSPRTMCKSHGKLVNFSVSSVPLVPAGDHGTIPAAMRNSKRQLFKYGECDKDWRQGVAASFTTSTCGPCAGPLTIRRGP